MEHPLSIAKKYAAYAVAGTAFGVGVPAAEAAPIYVNPPDVTYTGDTTVQFDIDGNGTNDFRLVLDSGSSSGYATWGGLGSNRVAVSGSFLDYDVRGLREGDVVGPGLTFGDGDYTLLERSKWGSDGQWPNDLNEYLFAGLRLRSGGQYYYGWARIGVSVQSGSTQAIVYDWAYESNPNTAITIAIPTDTEIPEPSSFALLALGALGIVALKKRARN